MAITAGEGRCGAGAESGNVRRVLGSLFTIKPGWLLCQRVRPGLRESRRPTSRHTTRAMSLVKQGSQASANAFEHGSASFFDPVHLTMRAHCSVWAPLPSMNRGSSSSFAVRRLPHVASFGLCLFNLHTTRRLLLCLQARPGIFSAWVVPSTRIPVYHLTVDLAGSSSQNIWSTLVPGISSNKLSGCLLFAFEELQTALGLLLCADEHH
jgi:hypothetical protein